MAKSTISRRLLNFMLNASKLKNKYLAKTMKKWQSAPIT